MAMRQVPEHIKFNILQRLLNLKRYQIIGLLESIWHLTAKCAPAGDIGKHSDIDIEAAVEWDGEPGRLIEALIQARWLDRDATHRLVVHDWHEHADGMVQADLAKKTLYFANGTRPKLSNACLSGDTRKRIKAEYDEKERLASLIQDKSRISPGHVQDSSRISPPHPQSSVHIPLSPSPVDDEGSLEEKNRPRASRSPFKSLEAPPAVTEALGGNYTPEAIADAWRVARAFHGASPESRGQAVAIKITQRFADSITQNAPNATERLMAYYSLNDPELWQREVAEGKRLAPGAAPLDVCGLLFPRVIQVRNVRPTNPPPASASEYIAKQEARFQRKLLEEPANAA